MLSPTNCNHTVKLLFTVGYYKKSTAIVVIGLKLSSLLMWLNVITLNSLLVKICRMIVVYISGS